MIAQKILLNYFTQTIVQIVQIGVSIYVARITGPSVFGTLAFGLSYVNMFVFLADLGFGTAHIKKISENGETENYLATFSVIKLFLIIFYNLFIIIFFFTQLYIFNVTFESRSHIYVIFISLIITSISQIYSIPKSTFSALVLQKKTDIPDFISTLVFQILRVVIVMFGYGAVALSLGNLAAVIGIAPLYWYFSKELKFGDFNKSIVKEYSRIALPVLLMGMTSALFSNLDKVLLQFFNNSTEVGLYSAGFRIGGFILIISQSISNIFFPTFSKAAANNNLSLIKEYVEKFEKLSFIILTPFVVAASIYAGEIVKLLLGPEYAGVATIMIMINISMFFRILMAPYGSVIAGFGYFNKSLFVNIQHFIFFTVSFVLLTHPKIGNSGAIGAALSYLCSTLFLLIATKFYAKKALKQLSHFLFLRYFIFSVIYSVAMYLAYEYFAPHNFILKLIFLVLVILAFYLLLTLFGLFKREDLLQIKIIFNISKFISYLRNS